MTHLGLAKRQRERESENKEREREEGEREREGRGTESERDATPADGSWPAELQVEILNSKMPEREGPRGCLRVNKLEDYWARRSRNRTARVKLESYVGQHENVWAWMTSEILGRGRTRGLLRK